MRMRYVPTVGYASKLKGSDPTKAEDGPLWPPPASFLNCRPCGAAHNQLVNKQKQNFHLLVNQCLINTVPPIKKKKKP